MPSHKYILKSVWKCLLWWVSELFQLQNIEKNVFLGHIATNLPNYDANKIYNIIFLFFPFSNTLSLSILHY